MIRIMTVVGNYYPFIGGAENIARYIVEQTNDADFKNDVLTIAGGCVFPLIKSPSEYSLEIMHTPTTAYSIHRVKPFSLFGRMKESGYFRYYTFASLLINLIRHSRNCDVIHAHTYQGPASAAVIVGKILNKPVIITGHNRISRLRDEIADGVMPSYLLKALKHCTRYVAISREIARECEAIAGMDANKICLVYNGIDTTIFSPTKTKAHLRDQLDLPADHVIVTCHGRLEKHKNQEMLINAFARTASKNALLLILGEGGERERLERLVADLGLTDKIWFLGFRKNTELYLQASDIYCLPSRLEGFSLALLEAMASGLLCIATDIEGNNDAIQNGENGFLFNPDDTEELANLLDKTLVGYNHQWAKEMGQRAREDVVKHFSLQHMVDAYRDIFRAVSKR